MATFEDLNRVAEDGAGGGSSSRSPRWSGGRRGRRGRDLPSQPRGRASPKTPTRGPLRCGARGARRPQSRRSTKSDDDKPWWIDRARATLGTGGGTRYRVGSMVTEVRGDEKDRAGRNQPRRPPPRRRGCISVPSRTREPVPAFRDERNREFAGRRLVLVATVWPKRPRSARRERSIAGARGSARDARRARDPASVSQEPPSVVRARARRVEHVRCLPPRASRRVICAETGSPVPPRSAWRPSARRHPSDSTSALDAAMSDPARIPDSQRSSGTGSRPDGDAAGASASTPPRADDRPKLELTGSMKKRRRKAEAKQTMKGMKNLIGEVKSKRAEEKRREQEETFPAPPVATSGPASASVPARSPPPPPRVRGGLVTPPATPSPPRHLPAVPERGDAGASLSPYSTATQDEAASALLVAADRAYADGRVDDAARYYEGAAAENGSGWAPLMALRAHEGNLERARRRSARRRRRRATPRRLPCAPWRTRSENSSGRGGGGGEGG